MRAALRSLVVLLAILMSVVAVPAYAGDDSPGLLDSVTRTVDTLTAPLKPKPAPTVAAPKPGPVKQLTQTVDTALGGQTSLSETPLVTTVDAVLGGQSLAPAAPQQVPDEVIAAPVVELVAPSTQVAAAQPRTTTLPFIKLSAFFVAAPAARPATAQPARTDEGGHVPGTSTLPDGGSPLTLTWLVLWVGVTVAGAAVVRRARASN